MSNWYRLDAVEVLHRLSTQTENGLSASEAARRLERQGANELIEKQTEEPWQLLWKQLTATMVVILIAAALLSAILGDYRDAIAILAIVIFNALLGFRQEYQAGRAITALKKLAVPTVKVHRDGTVVEISARELVSGDIVQLETGNLVPADCRLLETTNLRIQEASLTGESEPIDKVCHSLDFSELPLSDRLNMAYMGTTVTYGRGLAVVTETGMVTELGQIATAIQTVGQKSTRLQQRLDQLGRSLAIAIMILITLIFGVGLLRGEDLTLMFLTAVSLGVAAVPEGLPAVVTIALALGAKRMLKRQALIRQLSAVETLGSVTVICSDKTGTLTENKMTVTFLDGANYHIDLTAQPWDANPLPSTQATPSSLLKEQPALVLLLTGAALCNDACLEPDPNQSDHYQSLGDPTEGALVVAAAKLGLWKDDLEDHFPRVAEVPFDSERKRMTTVHAFPTATAPLPPIFQSLQERWLKADDAAYIAFTKGAIDSLLNLSSKVWLDGQAEPMTDTWRQKIYAANDQLAQAGMRILTVAFRPLVTLPQDDLENMAEQDLVFVGSIGMIDPARPEVKSAVLTCKTAGIRPVMITGDHPLTAQHIAHELGINTHGQTLTGQDLDHLSTRKLQDLVESVSVYARVSPQHKLEIVQALQNRGHIVAMTGDGINDAPALKQADIGVVMGIAGTDVAKEAADMLLLNDNFATIVAATKEGRVIYDNIRKFIKYVLTGNCGELWAIVLALFWDMPLLLLPLQILWINLIADGLLALALSLEPAGEDVMRRPPYKPNESIFSRGVGRDILWIGLLLGLVLLVVGHHSWATGQASWQTMVFSILAFSRIGLAQTMRSERNSVFRLGVFSNPSLLGIVTLTFGLQLAIIYVPALQTLFQTTALSVRELGTCLLLSTIAFWATELEKWFIRHR